MQGRINDDLSDLQRIFIEVIFSYVLQDGFIFLLSFI